jgi:hypothetical protein
MLATAANIAAKGIYLAPTSLSTLSRYARMRVLVNKKLAATDTNTSKDVQDDWKKLDIVNRACKTIVTEMTGTVMICLSTRATLLTII